MLSTCPPHVTGVALAVSSCPTTRCYWCCSGRLKLSDDQVLLVLRWPSQAVRRPGVTGVALAVSSCPTARYCCIRLLLLDGQVLLVLLWSSQAVRRPSVTATVLPPKQATTATFSGGTSVLFFLREKNITTL
jgi:hypothetical protein